MTNRIDCRQILTPPWCLIYILETQNGPGVDAKQVRFAQVSTINAAMAALMKTLTAFTKEKTIVTREAAEQQLQDFAIFKAKIFASYPSALCFR